MHAFSLCVPPKCSPDNTTNTHTCKVLTEGAIVPHMVTAPIRSESLLTLTSRCPSLGRPRCWQLSECETRQTYSHWMLLRSRGTHPLSMARAGGVHISASSSIKVTPARVYVVNHCCGQHGKHFCGVACEPLGAQTTETVHTCSTHHAALRAPGRDDRYLDAVSRFQPVHQIVV